MIFSFLFSKILLIIVKVLKNLIKGIKIRSIIYMSELVFKVFIVIKVCRIRISEDNFVLFWLIMGYFFWRLEI